MSLKNGISSLSFYKLVFFSPRGYRIVLTNNLVTCLSQKTTSTVRLPDNHATFTRKKIKVKSVAASTHLQNGLQPVISYSIPWQYSQPLPSKQHYTCLMPPITLIYLLSNQIAQFFAQCKCLIKGRFFQ